MDTKTMPPVAQDDAERTETPEERHRRIWNEMRTPKTPEQIAEGQAALARMNALMESLGDAALTEKDVAEYLAEQEALGLHHPLRDR